MYLVKICQLTTLFSGHLDVFIPKMPPLLIPVAFFGGELIAFERAA